jgi:hypothetical protein
MEAHSKSPRPNSLKKNKNANLGANTAKNQPKIATKGGHQNVRSNRGTPRNTLRKNKI